MTVVARRLLCPGGMTQQRFALGKTGEDLACRELRRRGYVILDRRYRRRGGELDVIARDGRTLVFVEVKTRRGCAFGGPAEAVTLVKRRRMSLVAMDYLMDHQHLAGCPVRFDVVAIRFDAGQPAIELYQNAFDIA